MPHDALAADTALGRPSVAAPPVALYVHIPFCISRCPYCDFVVYAGAAARGPRARIDAFTDALGAELELRADGLDARWGRPGGQERPGLASVYLGGGTPSLWPSAAVASLLDRVRRRFGLAAGAEVTLEVNPGPDERGRAGDWQAAGITRLSIGGQSLDATELRRLGRRHRPGDVAEALADARQAGIASVSLDLLIDIPGQTLATWERTLGAALDLGPDHVSVYALSLDDPLAEGLTGPQGDHLPTPPGAMRWRERVRAEQDEDRAAAAYELATVRLGRAGFLGYELSNWARPGHPSRHNLAYWRRAPYEALGPGAHAFDGRTRRATAARLDGYLAALLPATGVVPSLPPATGEPIDERTADLERVIVGLRLERGVPAGWADRAPLASVVGWATTHGLVDRSDGRLRLTTRGRLLSNELFERLV
jgi:oxygen-independent coproporphyrinogen-3 oxidase